MIGLEQKGVREVMSILSALEKKIGKDIAKRATKDANKEVMLPALKEKASGLPRKSIGGIDGIGGMIANAMKIRAMTKLFPGSYGSKVIIEERQEFIHYTKGSASMLKRYKNRHGRLVARHLGKRYFIPTAIEYGHGFPDRGGKKIKDVAPNSFMRTVFESKRYEAAKRTLDLIIQGIEKYVERYAKK